MAADSSLQPQQRPVAVDAPGVAAGASAVPAAARAPAPRRRRFWLFLTPLAAFALLAVLLGRGLSLDPREVPSPFVGKPAPAFVLPRLDDGNATAKLEDFAGKVWILNVWASWCGPCRDEHPLWVAFARRSKVPLVGLNYKDKRAAAQPWLAQLGDPYAMSLFDADGKVAIDWGVYGVPETFIIDRQGIVRLKHVGPITAELLRDKIEPLLKKIDG
ncbi:MAG: DsbE family thiol:disulfide interchange protein [Rubrivivax sp.]|nr:DsbE family thiol:disulfide interchange protein [Rubrivivax sp.]